MELCGTILDHRLINPFQLEAKARKSKQIWSKFTKGIEPFDQPMKYLEKTFDNSDSTIYQSRSSHDLAASMSSQLQFAHKVSDEYSNVGYFRALSPRDC